MFLNSSLDNAWFAQYSNFSLHRDSSLKPKKQKQKKKKNKKKVDFFSNDDMSFLKPFWDGFQKHSQ